MPTRTNVNFSRPGFIVDWGSVRRNSGRQIDWAGVATDGTYGDTGKRVIPAGTVMVEVDATGLIRPRPAGANVAGQTTVGLLASNADEGSNTDSLSGYGLFIGGVVYTELLPVAPDASALTALRGLDGGGFAFETYEDDRAS